MSDTAPFVTRTEFEGVLDRLQDLEDADYMRAVEADPSRRKYLPFAAVKRLVAGRFCRKLGDKTYQTRTMRR
jgi:hypothetical protein